MLLSSRYTGAMLVGACTALKPLMDTAANISSGIPKDNGKTGPLLDVGLNSLVTRTSHQFGLLGSLYATHILGYCKSPGRSLAHWEEEGKGNLLAQAAWPLLKKTGDQFHRNIEGRDILADKAV